MSIHQMRSFLTVAQKGSFSKAAQALYISTPALVQQMNLLEKSLGFELFVRSPRGISLTESGACFYDAAEKMTKIYDDAVEEGLRCSAKNERSLRIGVASDPVSPVLMEIIRCFSARYPDIKLQFIGSSYIAHLDDLEKDIFDICVSPCFPEISKKGISFLELYQDDTFLLVSRDHPFAGRSAVSPEELDGQLLLIEKTIQKMHMAILCEYLKKNVSAVRFESNFTSATKSYLISSCQAISIIPGKYTGAYTEFGDIVAVRLVFPKDQYGLIYREKSSIALSLFLRIAKECYPAGANEA